MNLRSGETAIEKINAKPKAQRKCKQKAKTMVGGQTEETDLQTLMLSIKAELGAFRADFNKHAGETKQEIAKLTQEVKGIQEEIKNIKTDVLDTQQRISDLEDKESTMNEILSHLLVQQSLMAEKFEYFENKSRQNNVRIHQVKEGSEGADIVKFVEELISEKLDIPDSELFIVAAHRSAPKNPDNGNASRSQENLGDVKPRSIVVRFLTWQTRQRVLQAAWDKKRAPIMHAGARIYFDQDYSTAIMNKRSQYVELRKQLREKNIKSHFQYPAKLKVLINGGEQVFNTATEASAALQAQGVIGKQKAHDGHVRTGKQTETSRKRKKLLDDKTFELLKKLNGEY